MWVYAHIQYIIHIHLPIELGQCNSLSLVNSSKCVHFVSVEPTQYARNLAHFNQALH